MSDAIRLLGGDFETILGLQGRARDEMVGEDEVLGAVSAAMQANPAFKQAMLSRIAKAQPVLQNVAPTKKRRQPLGLSYTFTADGTANITVQPQVLFRGEKLVVTETVAGATDINSIFIGNKSQFPTLQNPIASAAFAAGVLDNEMLFDTCQPSMFIQFSVTCSGGASTTTPIVWKAVIFGHTVQG